MSPCRTESRWAAEVSSRLRRPRNPGDLRPDFGRFEALAASLSGLVRTTSNLKPQSKNDRGGCDKPGHDGERIQYSERRFIGTIMRFCLHPHAHAVSSREGGTEPRYR